MKKIAIIGSGQLGSRHLQGTKKSINELEIWVVDSNKDALTLAQKRYEEVQESDANKIIHYADSLEVLPNELDLVIIATSSKPRASIIQYLLSHKKVSYLILEKFLFESLYDYDRIAELLKEKNVVTYVNTPRRLWDGYKAIKLLVNTKAPLKLIYENKNWGLCCNTIHFFDLFQFLTDAIDFTVDVSRLEPIILESKRTGYIELDGILEIRSNRNDVLHLACNNTAPHVMKIIQNDLVVSINESENFYVTNNKQFELGLKYQSELTGTIVDELLSKGSCDLPSYEQSAKLHKLFLSPLLAFVNSLRGTNDENCPIT